MKNNLKKIQLLILLFPILIFSQAEIKLNLATVPVLVPNIGVEIKTGDKTSIQLDVLTSFWDSFKGKPLHISQTIIEHRWYNNKLNFFIAPHIGYGMFTLQKPQWPVIYDHYSDISTYNLDDDSYQSGRIAFYGITTGYKKQINDRWSLEFFIGAGLTQSNYRGYKNIDGVITQVTPIRRDFDASGEVALYRGGIMLSYQIFNKK